MLSTKQVTALLLVAIIATSMFSVWAFDRIETHKLWVKQFNESMDYAIHAVQAGMLVSHYYNTSDDLQRFSLNNELYAASNLLRNLQDAEHNSNNVLALGKIRSFMSCLHNNYQNLTQLSPPERTDLVDAVTQIGNHVVRAYGAIFNYTSMDNSGPPFWYFGPSPPDQAELEEAATIAISAQKIIS